ncbi:MAG: cytochrome P450 [Pseudomonadota bacterium]
MQQINALKLAPRPPGPDAPATLGIDASTLDTLARAHRDHGDMVSLQTTDGRSACFVNAPEAAKQVLVRQHPAFRKGRGFERVKMLLGNGLIVSDGDTWRRARTMIQPVFKNRHIGRLVPVMQHSVARSAERWDRCISIGQPIDITRESAIYALETILVAIFGDDVDRDAIASGESPFSFLADDSSRDLGTVRRVRALREHVTAIIERRRAQPREGDLLDGYMAARDSSGQPFSDAELLDELMTLVIAGFETAANTLGWAWFLLADAPDVAQRLIVEARAALPDGAPATAEAVLSMTAVRQTLDEVMRLFPPVWLFTRRTQTDIEIGGFSLAADTDVYLSPYLMQRDAKRWPDPDRFDPMRFANPAAREAFFPFSLGPRRCLGEHFAYLEMALQLGLLLPRFELLRDGGPPPALEFAINLRTRDDIVLRPQYR